MAWLRAKRKARDERRRRWAIAIEPDPTDPDKFAPVVRLFDREFTAALADTGFHWQNRTVQKNQSDSWLSFEVAGTDLKVWFSALMGVVRRPGLENRFEALDYGTPEEFCAAVVASAVAEARRLLSSIA